MLYVTIIIYSRTVGRTCYVVHTITMLNFDHNIITSLSLSGCFLCVTK
jgi:hypothetical protein